MNKSEHLVIFESINVILLILPQNKDIITGDISDHVTLCLAPWALV